MGAAAIIASLLQIVLMIGAVVALGATVYYMFNRDSTVVIPPTWLPTWYINLVHVYPPNYTKSTTSNVISYSTPNNMFTAKTPKECVTRSVKGCKYDTDCAGFIYTVDNVSNVNTCTTLSDTSQLIVDPAVTSNTLYTVEGSEPAKYYAAYGGKKADTYTAASNITPYISATNYFDCASNCASNVSCLGFEFNPTTRQCIQRDAMLSSNLTADATLNSYVFKSGLTLMGSSPITFA